MGWLFYLWFPRFILGVLENARFPSGFPSNTKGGLSFQNCPTRMDQKREGLGLASARLRRAGEGRGGASGRVGAKAECVASAKGSYLLEAMRYQVSVGFVRTRFNMCHGGPTCELAANGMRSILASRSFQDKIRRCQVNGLPTSVIKISE